MTPECIGRHPGEPGGRPDPGLTALDAGRYKEGMRRLAGAVNVITSASEGRRFGMTATAVCSVSAEPPVILTCINRRAATYRSVSESGVFCINVLRSEDSDLATIFGGVQNGEERFGAGTWTTLATGAPVLEAALVSFDCKVMQEAVHGTHAVFIGEVAQIRFGQPGAPLLYSEGQYASLGTLGSGEPQPGWLEYWGGH